MFAFKGSRRDLMCYTFSSGVYAMTSTIRLNFLEVTEVFCIIDWGVFQ